MPKGAKMIKTAAMLANYCCTFTAVIFIYLLIEYSQLSDQIKSGFTEGARTRFVLLVVVCSAAHIFRSISALYAQRKAFLPESANRVIALSAVSLVLSVAWLVIVILQLTSSSWLVSVKNIEVIFLVMVIVDILSFSTVIFGAVRNKKQG